MIRTHRALLSLVLLASIASVPAYAADGVLIVQRITAGDGAAPTTAQVQIEPNKMRTEVNDPNSGSQTVIFDGTRQVLLLVNPARKSYMELTKADVDQLGAMVAQMQAQMANLPPEARAQVEGMMRGRGMGAAAAKIEYKRAGSDKVGRWTCDKYEGYRDGQKVTDLCTVSPATLGLTEADFAATQQMVEFLRALMPQGVDQIVSLGRGEGQGFSGVPVRSITTIGGQQMTMELTDVRRESFADSLFTVPAGFQKQDMMGMGRGSR